MYVGIFVRFVGSSVVAVVDAVIGIAGLVSPKPLRSRSE